METDAQGSQIKIVRSKIGQDVNQKYSVYIDGRLVGSLGPFKTGVYAVEPGTHQIRLAGSGRNESDTLTVKLGPGESQGLHTKSHGFGKNSLVMLGFFFPDRFIPRPWIVLKKTTE